MPEKASLEATCPECRGPLSLYKDDELVEIRCLVGHTYSPMTLLQAHVEAQESALWAAVVALREAGTIVDSLGGAFPLTTLERLRAQVEKKREQAMLVERVIADLEQFDLEART